MDKWYTIKDLAQLMRVSRLTISRLIKENRLEAVNVGTLKKPSWRIHDSAYQKFIAENYCND